MSNVAERLVRKFVPDEKALREIGTTAAEIGLITELLDLGMFNMGTAPSTPRNLLQNFRNRGWPQQTLPRFRGRPRSETDEAILFAQVETGLVRSVPIDFGKKPKSLPGTGEKLLFKWKFVPRVIDWPGPQEEAIRMVIAHRAIGLPDMAEDLEVECQTLRNTLTDVGRTLSDFIAAEEGMGERKSLCWKLGALHAIGELVVENRK